MLYILGKGFSTSGTKVFIGDNQLCSMGRRSYISTRIIVCKTPKVEEGVHKIKVEVSRGRRKIQSKCYFSGKCRLHATAAHTPYLNYISQQTIYPKADLSFSGKFRIEDGKNVQFTIGDGKRYMKCKTKGQQKNSEYSQYEVDKFQSQTCKVPEMRVGYFQFDSLSKTKGHSKVDIRQSRSQFGIPGKRLNLLVSPRIDSIKEKNERYSPNGQQFLVKGLGFSKYKNRLKVTVGNQKCTVLKSAYQAIICRVPPLEQPVPGDVSFVGGRGFKKYHWPNQNSFNLLNDIDATITHHTEHQTTSNQGVSITRGLFKAPEIGMYKFILESSSQAEFLLSTIKLDPLILDYDLDLESLINATNTLKDAYTINDVSKELSLEKDQYYYYEIRHKANKNGDHVKLGVEIPNKISTFMPINHAFEVTEIEIKYEPVLESFIIEIFDYDDTDKYFLGMKDCNGSKTFTYSQSIPVGGNCQHIVNAMSEFGVEGTCEVIELDITGISKCPQESADDPFAFDFNDFNDDDDFGGGGDDWDSDDPSTTTTTTDPQDVVATGTDCINPDFIVGGYQFTFTVTLSRNEDCKEIPRFLPVSPFEPPSCRTCKLYNGQKGIKVKELGSEGLQGYLVFNVNNDQLKIDFDEKEETLIDKVQALSGIQSTDIEVKRQGYCPYGCKWTISFVNVRENVNVTQRNNRLTFDPYNPALVVVTQIYKSSNNYLYMPITSEFLFTLEAYPQLRVQVESPGGYWMIASCTSLDCDYDVDLNYAPLVQDYIYDSAKNDLFVSISSTQIWQQSEFEIRFLESECIISKFNPIEEIINTESIVTSYQISCELVEKFHPAGDHLPKVKLVSSGFIPLNDTLVPTTISAQVFTIAPSTGSSKGGQRIVITGNHLGQVDEMYMNTQVRIGGQICNIISQTQEEIVCITPQGMSDSEVTITVNDVDFLDTSYSFLEESVMPKIEDFNPKSGNPVIKTKLIITGVNFNTQNEIIVELVSTNSSSRNVNCFVISNTQTEIQCIIRGGYIGSYKVQVHEATFGFYSNSLSEFIFEIQIQSITPNYGSQEGGQLISIQGSGFSMVLNENQVLFGIKFCEVKFASETEIKCITPPWSGKEIIAVDVLTKITEEAFCVECNFSYLQSATPKMTTVKKLGQAGAIFDKKVTSGDTIIIQGNLNLNGAVKQFSQVFEQMSLKLSQETVQLDLVGGNLQFTFPSLPTGDYTLFLTHETMGTAQGQLGEIILHNKLVLNNVQPSTGSLAGSILTLTGNGFSTEDVKVNLGDSHTCEIISQSNTLITCITPYFTSEPAAPLAVTLTSEKEKLNCPSCTFKPLEANTFLIEASTAVRSLDDGTLGITITGKFSTSIPSSQVQRLLMVEDFSNTQVYLTSSLSLSQPDYKYSAQVTSITDTEIIVNFENVIAGEYHVHVDIQNKGLANHLTVESIVIEAELIVDENNLPVPVSSSHAGGKEVTFTGFGFDEKTVGTIHGRKMEVATASFNSITFITPVYITEVSDQTFKLSQSGKISDQIQVTPIGDLDVNLSSIMDDEMFTYYESDSLTCWVGYDFGEGITVEFSEIHYLLREGSLTADYRGMLIEVSDNGIDWTQLSVEDNVQNDIFNVWEAEAGSTLTKRRFVRLSAPNTQCHFAEIDVIGKVFLNENHPPGVISISQRKSSWQTSQQIITYNATQTAVITSLEPNSGTTAGGELIVIKGNNFREQYCEVTSIVLEECETALSYCDGGYCSLDTLLTQEDCIAAGSCQGPGTCIDDQTLTELECETKQFTWEEGPMFYDYDVCAIKELTFISDNETWTQYPDTTPESICTVNPNNQWIILGHKIISPISVMIDEIECVIELITLTEIQCITGPRPIFVESTLKIFQDEDGYAATQGHLYTYVDRWSDSSTWGGEAPPREGDSVYIPPGQNILMDVKTPKLYAVIIEKSRLIFDHTQDVSMDAELIFIKQGHLVIGDDSQPICKKAVITFHGNWQSIQLPIYGQKGIFVREGSLNIHGCPKMVTWTSLDTTAAAGSNVITLEEIADWAVGDVIVIASTDYDMGHVEERTIVDIQTVSAKSEITLNKPLDHDHFAGDIQLGSFKTQRIASEVGLLTRNVVIQGDEQSDEEEYGAQIIISGTGDEIARGRIQYAEFRRVGQAASTGRYPINFHMIGKIKTSIVKGNSIRDSHNRAVAIHGCHYLKVEDNVVYNIKGHAFFLEDGIETNNIFQNNLAINQRSTYGMLATDQMPAAFWISNPNNYYINNHVAGSDHCGFWYSLDVHPDGMSETDSICIRGTKLGSFRGNVAHSTWRYGLRIYPELIPRRFPCLPNDFDTNPGIEAVFEDFLTYKNQQHGVIVERIGKATFRNITSLDNGITEIEISVSDLAPDMETKIVDSTVVGWTSELHEGISKTTHRGVITPRSEGFLVDGVDFHNYNLHDDTHPELVVLSESSCSNADIKDKEVCLLSGICQGSNYCTDAALTTKEDCEAQLPETWILVNQLEQVECETQSFTFEFFTWTDVGQNFYAIGTCSHCNLPGGGDSQARTVTFNRLTFNNTQSYIHYGGQRRAILSDLDGSLTGNVNGWATPFYNHNNVPGCVQNDLYSGLICDNTTTIRRLAFTGLSSEINGKVIKLLRLDEGVDLATATDLDFSILSFINARDPPRAWAIPIVLGHNYNIHWSNVEINWKDITLIPSIYNYVYEDAPIELRFNYTAERELFEVEYYPSIGGKNLFPHNDQNPLDLNSKSGDFYVDTAGKNFHIRIDGTRMGKFIIRSIICRDTCPPKPPPPLPPQSGPVADPWTFSMSDEEAAGKIRYWNDSSWWKVPVDGDDVHIEASWRVVVDVEQTAKMKNFEVSGHLIIPVVNLTYPITHINAEQMWFNRNGKIVVGTSMVLLDQEYEDTDFQKRRFKEFGLHLNCTGNQSTETFTISPNVEVLYNTIATTVNFQLIGRRVYKSRKDNSKQYLFTTKTFLAESTKVGDQKISVGKLLGWKKGDRILITTSQMNRKAFDEGVIKKIDKKKSIITLEEPLKFAHVGGQNERKYLWGKVDIRSQVAVMNRSVVVECRIQPFKYFNEYTFEDNTGKLYLDNIEMKNCGTTQTNKGCINYETIKDGQKHIVMNSMLHDGKSKGVVAFNSNNLIFANNVLHTFNAAGMDFRAVKKLNVLSNLISNIKGNGIINSNLPGVQSYGNGQWGIRFYQNYVVGSSFANYILTPGPCKEGFLGDNLNLDEEDNVDLADEEAEIFDNDYSFYNNIAVSGKYGILTAAWGFDCTRLHHFQAVKASVSAVTSIWSNSHLRLDHLVLSDNKNAITAMIQVENDEVPFFRLSRSSIIGMSCFDDNTCDNINPKECSFLRGIMHPNSQISRSYYPRNFRLPFNQLYASPTFTQGVTSVRNCEFRNFADYNSTDENNNFTCRSNSAYVANVNNPDLAPLMTMRRLTLNNVPLENFARFYDPQAKWLEYKHLNCLNVNCYNPRNVIIRMLDDSIIKGEIFGKGSTLISNNPGIADSSCTRIEQWNGYHCNHTRYTLVLFEILDANRNKKVQRPITFSNEIHNFTNVVSPMMDKSDSSYDISGQRFPRFAAAVRKNLHYVIDFVGHRPYEWKWQLQYSKPLEYIVVEIDYVQPNSLELSIDGEVKKPIVVSSKQEFNYTEELMSAGPICGRHIFVYEDTRIYFILTGDSKCVVHIKQIDAIRLTLKIEMPIQDFYDNDGQMTFIDKMTTFLGIPHNKLKIVSIVQGSVIIDYEVILDDETKSSKKFQEIMQIDNTTTSNDLQETCQGVTQGISKGIQDGELDFGAPVSKLTYQCTEIVDNDEDFENKIINGGEKPIEVISGEVTFKDVGKKSGSIEVKEEDSKVQSSELKWTFMDVLYRVLGAFILLVVFFTIKNYRTKRVKITKKKNQLQKKKKIIHKLKQPEVTRLVLCRENLHTQNAGPLKQLVFPETSRNIKESLSSLSNLDSPLSNKSSTNLIKEKQHIFLEEVSNDSVLEKEISFDEIVDVLEVDEEI